MKNRFGVGRTFVLGILLLGLSLAGCSGEVSFTSARLSEATMCLGVDDEMKPVNPTDTFGVTTPEIFCSAKLSNAPSDTEVGAEWIYVKGEAAGVEDYVIDTVSVTTDGTRYLFFSLPKSTDNWPVGEYQLNLTIDGKQEVSLPFTVSNSSIGTGGATLSGATMALGTDAQSKPINPTTTFPANTPELFCSVLVSNAPAGTEILSEWYYVSGAWQGVTNRLVGSVPLAVQGTQYASLSLLAPDEGWPAGQYQVKLYLNGVLQDAVPFSIESAPITAVMAMSVDSDNQPVNPTTSFPIGVEKVYTVIYVNEVPAGAKMLVEWYDTGSSVSRLVSKYEADVKASEKPTWVNSSYGTGGWPKGQYATVISINGEREIILPFTVQ